MNDSAPRPWAALFREEDWWANWLGAALLGAVLTGAVPAVAKVASWQWPSALAALPPGNLPGIALLALGLGLLFGGGLWCVDRAAARRFPAAFAGLFALTLLAMVLGQEKTAKHYELGYPFWAVGLGLLIANTVGTPAWMRPALRAEFYIKTGLVLLGAEVLFGNVMRFGAYGLAIAWGVTPVVIVFMWIFGTRILRIANKPLVIVIAAATSVCGVSAAIAAAAASRAKKEDLAIAIGMSLLFTIGMMVGMPVLIRALGLPAVIGGAWMGGTIDSTGAVVAAGAALGEEAEAAAAIVKMIQNLLIGVIAFAIALYWVGAVERDPGAPRPGAAEIWRRLPKFVLGFIAASLLASFVFTPLMGADGVAATIGQSKVFRDWLFALAFLCVGLDANFKAMAAHMSGGRPVQLYLVGQTFNIVLTLAVAWLVLSGVLFPLPPALTQ
jgi:uncharacterized membrane protein YadS